MPFTGGAPAVVRDVMNIAWQVAQEKSAYTDARTDAAINVAGNAPQIKAPNALDAIEVPDPQDITALSPSQALALYSTTAQQVQQMLTSSFTSFLASYFPVGSELAAAQQWLQSAIGNGGSGINAGVEAQLWERDRSRVLAEAARAQDEVLGAWAARGYALPPGAAAYQVLQVQKAAQDKVAEVGRTAAIKSFDTEIENVRFAVKTAIDYRVAAIGAAGEYIKALALGPQVGAEVASTVVEAQGKLADAAASYYRAQIDALRIPLQIATTNAELQQRTNEANLGAQLAALKNRVDAALAAAQSAGTQAAAALNALNAGASISGNDTTTINL